MSEQLQHRVHFEAGKIIFREGEPGDTMYYILSGSVQILKNLAGIEKEVNVLEAGDFFGEIAILQGGPRTATVRAKTDVDLAVITSQNFEGLLALSVEIPIRMLRSLSGALKSTQRQLHEALEILSRAERERLELERSMTHRAEEAERDGRSTGPVPETLELARFVLRDGSRHWAVTGHETRLGRRDRVTGIVPHVDLSGIPESSSVSRLHARVFHESDGFWLVEEMGVTNGTIVNGKRIDPGEPFQLHHGDRVTVGGVHLVFSLAPSLRTS